jgi:hypothetical protein
MMQRPWQAAVASNDKEEEIMTFRKLCHTALAGAALTMFGFGSAYAQDLDDMKICEAAATAFQAFAANNQDADLESAKGEVAQGLADCKSGKTAEGLATINLATAEISDGVQGSHKHKT